MTIKKIGVFIGTVGLITALVIGCGSSSTNNNESNSTGTDNNSSEIGLEAGSFYGAAFSFILKGLANGMLSTIVSDSMGNYLSFLGGGDSGNAEEMNELKDIDNKLTQISNELVTIESELKTILTDIKVTEDSIKADVDWPRDAVNTIDTATQVLQELGVDTNGTKIKPGEGNLTKIADLASDILSAGGYDIPLQVMAIYNAIEGNPTPLLSNYIEEVMLQLSNNDDENLQKAYQGFEYYTSELLNYQIQGVNLVVEAHKAQDDNASAQKYLNCYDSDMYGTSECNLLYKEIGDMDNKTSFIYNAVSLVLRDAPVYNQLLPSSAENILGRAEFYRLLMTGTDGKKYGLRIFHISTADMEKSPDQLFVSEDGTKSYSCQSSRHTVTGKTYDFWTDDTVKASEDYNVVEYYCADIPNGKGYKIFSSNDLSNELGSAIVSQYDTNYDQNSSGTISYGFGLVTNSIDNRFTKSSDKWTTQKHRGGDCDTDIYGGPNSRPLQANVTCYNEASPSNASIELDGHFEYDSNEEERTMYAYWHVKFHLYSKSPKDGGGDAYSYYYVGVYDGTAHEFASSDCKNKTYFRLHASEDHRYSETHYESNHCSFTAKPGHHYYVYFKVKGYVTIQYGNSGTYATSELDTVYYVHLQYFEGGK